MENRIKEQKEQMQCWIMQQLNERHRADKKEKDEEKAYHDCLMSMNNRALALEKMEQDCKRCLNEATAKFNLTLVFFKFRIFII